MKYDLAEMVAPPRGKTKRGRTTVPLPQIKESLRAEKAYLKILRDMLSAIADVVKEEVIPEAQREIARMHDGQSVLVDTVDGSRLYFDAMAESLWQRIRAMAASLSELATRMVDRVFMLESVRHTEKFIEAADKALGIDLRAVVRQQDLNDLLAAVSVRNAALIRDISQETVNKVAQATVKGVLDGAGQKALKTDLKAVFEVSDSRAELIAADQTAKLNSNLNQFRQSQAGIDKYTWRTAHDKRVRPLHRGLEGKVYAWGEPTGAEGGAPPGQPVRCRCIAQAIVEF